MSSLDDINKYIDDGDYRKALEELDLIISKEPDNAKAFYMRGKYAFIELQNENFDNAKSEITDEKNVCSHIGFYHYTSN